MRKKFLLKSIISTILFIGTQASSDSRLDYNIDSTSLDVGTLNDVAVGLTYGLDYKSTMENNVVLGGQFLWGTVSTAISDHRVLSYGLGLGYMFANDLDTKKGVGSSFEIGSEFNTTNISGDGLDLSDNSTILYLRSEFALSKGFAVNVRVAAPYDGLGDTISSAFGLSFSSSWLGDPEFNIAYLSEQSNLEGVSANMTGLRLGWINRF